VRKKNAPFSAVVLCFSSFDVLLALVVLFNAFSALRHSVGFS
jgi:hypothetical protein